MPTDVDMKKMFADKFGTNEMTKALAAMFIESMHESLVAMAEDCDGDDRNALMVTEDSVREAAHDYAADMLNDLKKMVCDEINKTVFAVTKKVVVTSELSFGETA